ncbi:MAG: hypothetical protein AAGA48_19525 [Myxococcota bacterium]
MHRFGFVALILAGCDFNTTNLFSFNGMILNDSDATIVEVRTYTIEASADLAPEDCEDQLRALVEPGGSGEIRWPALRDGGGWDIEVVLEPGGCTSRGAVWPHEDFVVPAGDDPKLAVWSSDCLCEELSIGR